MGVGASGLAVGGLTMLAVPLIGVEPPTWLFLLGVIPAFVGLVAAGILGRGRVWPWWVGVALALFLPIMFLMPFNSIPMAAVWVCVASSAGRASRHTEAESGGYGRITD